MKAGLCEESPSAVTTVSSILCIVPGTADSTYPCNNATVRSEATDSAIDYAEPDEVTPGLTVQNEFGGPTYVQSCTDNSPTDNAMKYFTYIRCSIQNL
jgi:hypothetical protein